METTLKSEALQAVERAYAAKYRVRIWYGDTETGQAWPEEWDVTGYIGRSTAYKEEDKIFLLVNNRRSLGGPGLLMDCIVRIDTTNGRTLYKHSTFSAGQWGFSVDPDSSEFIVHHNGKAHAKFPDPVKASRYIDFMTGKRYSK